MCDFLSYGVFFSIRMGCLLRGSVVPPVVLTKAAAAAYIAVCRSVKLPTLLAKCCGRAWLFVMANLLEFSLFRFSVCKCWICTLKFTEGFPKFCLKFWFGWCNFSWSCTSLMVCRGWCFWLSVFYLLFFSSPIVASCSNAAISALISSNLCFWNRLLVITACRWAVFLCSVTFSRGNCFRKAACSFCLRFWLVGF